MKNMALKAELELEERKLTNHLVRKTLVMKLKAWNHPKIAVICEPGHTDERWLAEYEEGVETEQRQISYIDSSTVGQQVHNSRPVLTITTVHRLQPAKQQSASFMAGRWR